VSTVDLGPAPGLVADWFSPAFTVLVVAVTALVWLTVGILRWMDTAHQPPVEPPSRAHTCVLSSCHEPADHVFYGPEGPVYTCRAHSGEVALWCGPSSVYDQDAS
jgi:hypothetical protein